MAASGLAVGFEWTPFITDSSTGNISTVNTCRRQTKPDSASGWRDFYRLMRIVRAIHANGSIPASTKAHTRRLDGCWRVDVMWMHYWHRWSGC